jgi:hypothetical protein
VDNATWDQNWEKIFGKAKKIQGRLLTSR